MLMMPLLPSTNPCLNGWSDQIPTKCRRAFGAKGSRDYYWSVGAPKRPLVAIIGGAKVSTKLDVLDNLLHKVDVLYIAGAMANTFLAGHGQTMGKSIYEPELVDKTKEITNLATERGVKLVLPNTLIISQSPKEPKDVRTVPPAHVEAGDYIVDLGPGIRRGGRGVVGRRRDGHLERTARTLRGTRVCQRLNCVGSCHYQERC